MCHRSNVVDEGSTLYPDEAATHLLSPKGRRLSWPVAIRLLWKSINLHHVSFLSLGGLKCAQGQQGRGAKCWWVECAQGQM